MNKLKSRAMKLFSSLLNRNRYGHGHINVVILVQKRRVSLNLRFKFILNTCALTNLLPGILRYILGK